MPDIKILPTDRVVFNLNLPQIDYNEQREKSLRKEIADKYNIPLKNVTINFNPVVTDGDGNKISLAEDIISNIQSPEYQQTMMKDYIDIKKIEDVDIKDIYEIDNIINSFVDFDSYSKHKTYKFKYVKWDNYLSYGKGNYFDFTKLKGLILLEGEPENQCGKTTFAIDLLRFGLFGSADKSPTLDAVFNSFKPEETEVKVEVCLDIDGVDYVIRRTITRPALKKRTEKSKSKQKVEYFKLINGSYEEIDNCEAETVQQTNNVIKETVGNVDDFNLVISATSDNLSELLKLGQTDKSRLFSRWLGLVTLEDKEKIAKNYYKTNVDSKLLSNKYDKATLLGEIEDYKTLIIDNENKKKSEELKQKEIELNIERLNSDKTKVLSSKKEIKDSSAYDIRSVENQLMNNQTELENKRLQFKQLKEEYAILKDSSFDIDAYKKKREEILGFQTRNGELKGLISAQNSEKSRIQALIEEKVCSHCGHKIDAEEKNDEIQKINAQIQDLIQEGVSNKAQIDKIQAEIDVLEKNREDTDKLNNIKLKLSAIKVTIDNLKMKIENLLRQKTEFESNKENIQYNNELDSKVRVLDEQIKVETRLKDDTIRLIQRIINENNNYNEQIELRDKTIKKLQEEEKIIRNWKIYQELIGKNGIVKLALRKALPIINNEVKRMLNGICDFEVVLSINDDNKINLNLVKNNVKLDMSFAGSGWEKTVTSLALRAALGNIASFSKPNVLVLDEVIGGPVGVQNVDNVMTLYHRILNNYDYILHICHSDVYRDYHDGLITICKKDDVSVIETSNIMKNM